MGSFILTKRSALLGGLPPNFFRVLQELCLSRFRVLSVQTILPLTLASTKQVEKLHRCSFKLITLMGRDHVHSSLIISLQSCLLIQKFIIPFFHEFGVMIRMKLIAYGASCKAVLECPCLSFG